MNLHLLPQLIELIGRIPKQDRECIIQKTILKQILVSLPAK